MANEVKKSSRVVDTWKQKKWYKVLAPASFNSIQIGETVAVEDAGVLGRTVTTSLMNITGDMKKQSLNGTFEVTAVKNGNAETQLKKLEIAPSSVRRMVKKGKDRLDMSFLSGTKDNLVVRIKPMLVTRSRAGGSLLTKIRHLADAAIRVETHNTTFDELLQDVIANRLQKKVKMRINRLYPLKSLEIRSIELTTTTKPLPPVPTLEELKEEVIEETEEEKIEKKVKAKKTTKDVVETVEA